MKLKSFNNSIRLCYDNHFRSPEHPIVLAYEVQEETSWLLPPLRQERASFSVFSKSTISCPRLSFAFPDSSPLSDWPVVLCPVLQTGNGFEDKAKKGSQLQEC